MVVTVRRDSSSGAEPWNPPLERFFNPSKTFFS